VFQLHWWLAANVKHIVNLCSCCYSVFWPCV
jgi:hypothetical protein